LNVYCILAHDHPSNLKSLLDALQGKKIILHLDKSIDRDQFLKDLGPLPNNLDILSARESFRVEWAGWNMVRAEISLFRKALKFLGAGDHAILLSGSCYPCRPVHEFEDFLYKNSSKEFISFNELRNVHNLRLVPTDPGEWKVKNLHLNDMIPLPPINWLIRFAYKARDFLNAKQIRNPRFDPKYRHYVGSQWIALSQKMVLSVVQNEDYLKRKFRFSFAPDELAIQSFVVTKLGPDSASLLEEDFDTYATISGPFHYLKAGSTNSTIEDLDAILASKKFFVRKPTPDLRDTLRKNL
jgi:Core-2/I-Branching enzyme